MLKDVERNVRRNAVIFTFVAALVVSPGCRQSSPATVQIAVASNFAGAMTHIALQFQISTGHPVALSFGSTGKHYAQIRNGAPFDAFFAADAERPTLLETEGHAVTGSRFTYAIGRLVLWSPRPDYVDPRGRLPADSTFRFLAIANPALAPYGRAAREVLERMGRWESLSKRIVRGENIGQSFQYVQSGNAELGFVACSQIDCLDDKVEGSMWLVPDSLHTPIEQQAVLLKDSEAARAFLAFVGSSEVRQIIHDFGYNIP